SIYLEVDAQYVEMDTPGPIYGCDGSFYDSGGGFSTYGLNESYTLTFYPSTPNSKLTFNFYDFATEYLHDFLWAYDGTSIAAPQIGVYNDGNGPLNNNITATNPDGAITFKFSSNSYTNWQGWHAVFNCIPDGSAFYTMSNLSTPQVDTVCSGFFMDNGGLSNNYSYNLNSAYTFYPATPGSSVQVNFDYFFTDEDYDGLMIYNGPDTTYPVIASPYPSTILPPTCPIYSWHGTNGPNLVKSTDISGALTFVFRSNNGWNYPGWFAPISCVPNTGNHILMNDITTTHTTCNAMFYDSGSDLGNYSNNENYTQTFIPDNNTKKILIDFGNISLSSGDTLFVYDGLNTSGILKATYTGANSSINISSTHPTGALTIRFKSDGSNIGEGWHAGISCIPKNYPSYLMSSTQNSYTTCVGNFYDNGGINSNYLNQSAQTMTFYPGTPGFVTQIDFLSFNTEASFDGLRIYDGPNALAPQILSGQPVGANTLTCPANAFSGNISPGTITSSHATGALTFVFITDNSGNESGWEATVNCVNPNTISYAAFTSNVNQITTGGTVNFTDLSNNNPTNWLWSFPGGTPSSSTLQNPGNIVYNTPGCYNVVLTVSNANGSNTHTESCYINVSVPQIPPVAAFTANNFNITVGGSINFTDLSNNYPTSWQWNFAGGTPSTSTIQNPSNIIYNTPGCYEVTLTASNAFGNDTETQTCYITVNPPSIPPTANFVANITYISPSGSVDFTDLSSSNTTQWNWTFTGGIPSSSTLQNPNNIIYNTPGCYPVKLIAINAFGSDTLEYNCYITVSNPALACTEMIISEYIESSASNRALEFQNLSSSVIDLTSYSVELYSNGASSASSSYNFTGVLGPQQVFVLAHPSANTTILAQADATSNVCNYGGNDAIALKKNGVVIDVIGEIGYYPGLNGNWIAGSGNTFDHTLVRLPYIDYPTSSWDASFTQWAAYQNGTYNYLGFNSNNCSGGAPTIPDANFMANNVTINAGQSINFTDLSNNQPTSWLWSFQGATPTSSTNQNPSNIVYNTPGCYEVSLTASNSAGSDTYTISCYITVVSSTLPPEANFTASTFNITAGQTVDFYDISTNNPTAWNWSFTGASPATSTVQNPTNIVYNTPGCYQVSLTASNAAGNNTATQTCYINVISNTGACSELFFSEYLEGVSNDKAIEIYNPSAIALNLSSYSIEMYANGAVIPTATLNLSGSLASNSVFVISNSNASAAILAQTDLTTGSVCNFNGNDAIVLKKNGTVIDVIGEIGVNPGTAWNVGSGSTLDHTLVRSANVNGPTNLWSTNQTQYISYPVGTSSYLGLNTNNCASSALVPVANFTANTFTINAGQSVNFTDLSTNTPTSWSWVFTGGTPASSTVQNPTNIVYNTPGCYQVTLTATNSAGSNTSTQTCYINVTNPVIAPVANFTASSVNITSGQSVNFTDLSTNNPTSWNWTFAGAAPASSTSQNPTNITYNTAGCYQVSLTATNSAGSNTSTQTCYINVTNPVIVPVANFTASNFNITTGLSVNFTDLSTNNPTSWNWLFTGAAPASSTSQNPSNITYNTAGCYQVSLTATNSAGSNTSTQTCYITVTNPIITPVANFTA
ncbi:MAG TPA: PKD domain-containing protein, partial [Bacteroidia bacterium]|nr:PKD domain-containing protein [Bacteroidia bacterium]